MRSDLPLLTIAVIFAGACSRQPEPAAPAPVFEAPAPAEPAAEPPTAAEPPPADDAEAARAAKIAEVEAALAKAEADADADAVRWTPELRKKASALAARSFKSSKAALQAIVKSPHRHPDAPARDRYRHPVETLTFFGIQPTMTVIELGVGRGWYTEILAPLLARRGKLVAVAFDPEGPPEAMTRVYGRRAERFLADAPELYGKVERVAIQPPDRLELGPAGSADMVLALREVHGWQRRGQMAAYLAAVHAVLKDGGVFGVVDHRAAPGSTVEAVVESGYLPEQWVIETVEAAGFQLAGRSEINANPKDTRDHPKGVWTLPPGLALGDQDRERYVAIGESDRFTLKFVKRAAR
jgi:predicted methyltransferase